MFSRRSTDAGIMNDLVRAHSSVYLDAGQSARNEISLSRGLNINDNDNDNSSDEEFKSSPDEVLQQTTTDNLTCRICLSEEELPNHELITPCKCGGSMRFIGLSCLKEWLKGKRHSKCTYSINSYIWRNLECEICKEPF